MSTNVNGYRMENFSVKLPKQNTEVMMKSSWKDVKDIFKFDNAKPYIIISPSGGGKTTLCYDIIYQKAREATRIYYVSSTVASAANNIIESLPNAVRSQCTIENLLKIWQEITSNTASYYYSIGKTGDTNNGPRNILATIYSKIIKNAGIMNEDKQWRFNIIKEFPNVFPDVQTELNKSTHYVIEKIAEYFGDQYFQQKNANNNDKQKETQYDADSKRITEAFYQETLIRLIINTIQNNPKCLDTNSENALSDNEISVINGFYSEKPKSILIIDDCTETLVGFIKDTKNKKTIINGQPINVSTLYQEYFMKSILTRARHNNCLICRQN